MHKLKSRDYRRVSRLFKDLRYNLVVDSVIVGNTPGLVYVDDALRPRTAWMWNRMGTMLLTGDPANETFNRALSDLLQERIVPAARRGQIPSLTLHYAPDTWEDQVGRLVRGARPREMWRRCYQFEHLEPNWRDQLPSECVIERIDARLLNGRQMTNLGAVVGWIHSFWHTIEDFIDTGFGFCLVQDQVIASWCLTVYASDRDFELGLATVPDYRNRGYATLAASACVQHGVERGFTLHWHCDEDNRPSVRVAEKVGFSDPTRYRVYALDL